MAAKTDFSDKQLSKLLSLYDIGDFVDSRPFSRGADQTNICLSTTRSKYAFRYYEKRDLDYVRFEVELLQYLAGYNYPSPGPISDKTGEFINVYASKPYVIFEFLEGEHNDSRSKVAEVAGAIGHLHSLTEGYRPKHSSTRVSEDIEYARSWAHKSSQRLSSPSEANERLEWVEKQLEALDLPDSLPKGVCHGDTNPGNFLYKDGELLAVLDFDQANYTFLLLDIGSMIMWYAWDRQDFNWATIQKLISCYETKRRLTNEEKRHMYDALILVNIIGMSWFLDKDTAYQDGRTTINELSNIGRSKFYTNLFY
jgi:homoserine kinase type II